MRSVLVLYEYFKVRCETRTFHDVDDAPHVTLLDDEAAGRVLHGVHAVHDLADLRHLQVLHEVVVQNSSLYQLPGPVTPDNRSTPPQTHNIHTIIG